MPTSLNRENKIVDELPASITHVYTRQYDVKGLSSKFVGPFPVTARPTRSTIEIKVGTNKDKTDRLEVRHVSDIKVAHMRDDALEATRPKRGRPRKTPVSTPDQPPPAKPTTTNHTYNLRNRQQSSIDVASIDFSIPPPNWKAGNTNGDTPRADPTITGPPPMLGFPSTSMWSASTHQLKIINDSITGA